MNRFQKNLHIRLINKLLENPVDFEAKGRGNELLTCYFHGAPLGTLAPLLAHPHDSVRGTAMFVVNELGPLAKEFVDTSVALCEDADPRIAWDAMESVLECAIDSKANRFVAVIKQLESQHGTLRRLAMRLTVIAYGSQLEASIEECRHLGSNSLVHVECLTEIAGSGNQLLHVIPKMLAHHNVLAHLYGAIAICRLNLQDDDFVKPKAYESNPDIQKFWMQMRS